MKRHLFIVFYEEPDAAQLVDDEASHNVQGGLAFEGGLMVEEGQVQWVDSPVDLLGHRSGCILPSIVFI